MPQPATATPDAPTHVWLDCDPGHDDALAILLAAYHPGATLIGVSTVASNHTLGRVTANAGAVLTAAGLAGTVPLVPGAARPLFGPPLACPAIHGASGLCTAEGAFADAVAATGAPGPTVHAHQPAIATMAAAIAAAHAALNAGRPPHTPPRRVALVATGALTNVALLLWVYPAIAGLVSLSVMGGAVGAGNTHPVAEFNLAVDPHAGAAVWAAAGFGGAGAGAGEEGGGEGGASIGLARAGSAGPTTAAPAVAEGDGADAPPPLPVALCPLEVTHTALVTPSALDAMGLSEGDGGGGGTPPLSPFKRAVRDLLLFFHASYASTFDGFKAGPPLHDPCAVLLALERDTAFTLAPRVRVDVEAASPLCAGQTVIDLAGVTGRPPNAAVALKMDTDRLWAVLGEAVAAADAVSPLNGRGGGAT